MTLTIENYWHKEGGLWQDPDLKKVKASSLRYRPRPITPQQCLPDAVLTLRGPRRSGKTVTLKLLVAELIEKEGLNPQQVFWRNFEGLRSLEQIESLLRILCTEHSPRVLFIDEVTAVIGWQRVIKKLKDEGFFADCSLILTGSSAHDLKKGSERMAGRRGEIEKPDQTLLPMGYRDFEIQLDLNNIRLTQEEKVQSFLLVGGFPFRVERFIQSQLKNEAFEKHSGFQIFDDVIFYEINRRRLDRTIALEIIGRLSQIGTTAVSYDALCKPLSISRDTLKRYLNAFGDSFLLATISTFDTARNRVAPKKDRKFVWIDPALGELAAWLGVGEAATPATRAEWVVGAELLRQKEIRLFEGLSAPRSVFTWKSSSGNEVDFLFLNRASNEKMPVEVKYQNQISDWDFQVMERAFGCGIIVSKDESRQREKTASMDLASFLKNALPIHSKKPDAK